MLELFSSEWRRFRTAALVFASLHLIALVFFNRIVDVLNTHLPNQILFLAFYLLAGFGFAVYQFGTLRQRGRWIWLLHRPLPHRAVFLAVAGAGAAVIAVAVGLPLLLTVAGLDLLTPRVVDRFHYVLAAHALLLVCVAWTAGCHVMLFRSPLGIAVVFLPWLLLGRMASVFVLLPLALVCIGLMLAIACGSFKPDRRAESGSMPVRLLTALPFHLAGYFVLLWLGSALSLWALFLSDELPGKMLVPPVGGQTELERADPVKTIALGLAQSGDPRAAGWTAAMRRQTALELWPNLMTLPIRYQWGNWSRAIWQDREHGVSWTFSHDAMSYAGLDGATGRPVGRLGTTDAGARFDAPPTPFNHGSTHVGGLLTARRLYRIDAAGRAAHPVIALHGAERLLAPPDDTTNAYYAVTSADRLLVYDLAPLDAPTAPLRLRHSVRLPAPAADLSRLTLAEVPDGLLVSASYLRGTRDAAQPHQIVLHVDRTGRVETVARRAVGRDLPALFEHRGWWLSPALHAVLAARDKVFDNGALPEPAYPARPASVLLAAVWSALLAAAGAALWLRPQALPRARNNAWFAVCLLLGLPALAALMALHPRRLGRARAMPLAATAPA